MPNNKLDYVEQKSHFLFFMVFVFFFKKKSLFSLKRGFCFFENN
jgi:hypothetical protein